MKVEHSATTSMSDWYYKSIHILYTISTFYTENLGIVKLGNISFLPFMQSANPRIFSPKDKVVYKCLNCL